MNKLEEAKAVQEELAKKVILKNNFNYPIRYIGGMDLSNTPFDSEKKVFGASVVCSYSSLSVIESVSTGKKEIFPYIRGFLGFREVPTLVETYKKLRILPDIIMVDGHGISHPRGLGVASHLGVVLDRPTIGVAKSILVGTPAATLGEEVGSTVPLIWKGMEIAMMVRTKRRCLPLIISVGHMISLETATQVVLKCLKKHRLPEPTRFAHLEANHHRKSWHGKC